MYLFAAYRISTGEGTFEVSCPANFCQWNEQSSNRRCHCDAECITMGDCCLDHFALNKRPKNLSLNEFLDLLTRNRSDESMVPFYSCPSVPIVSSSRRKTVRHLRLKTVSICWDTYGCNLDTQAYCDGRFIYSSKTCLSCNNIHEDAWPLIEHYYGCPEDLLERFRDLYLTNFTHFRNVAINKCSRAFELPKQCERNIRRITCLAEIGNCYLGLDNMDILHYHAACMSFNDPFLDNDTGRIYKNAFCVLCEGRGLPNKTCDLPPIPDPSTAIFAPQFTIFPDADGQYYSPELDLQRNSCGRHVACFDAIQSLIWIKIINVLLMWFRSISITKIIISHSFGTKWWCMTWLTPNMPAYFSLHWIQVEK